VAGLHFFFQRRKRNEAKKTPSNNRHISVPSVQLQLFGPPKARSAHNNEHWTPCPPLSTTHTLRHQCGNPLIRPPRCALLRPNGGDCCNGGGVSASDVLNPFWAIPLLCVGQVSVLRIPTLVAKRVGICERRVGVPVFCVMRRACFWGTKQFGTARSGHLCALVWKAFSLLRFFFAVGKRNEVPPRTVANSAKENS
jgi:hypothetical protein